MSRLWPSHATSQDGNPTAQGELWTERVLREWDLTVGLDAVLRSQGADPAVLTRRRPWVVDIAEAALEEGLRLIDPAVLMRRLRVSRVCRDLVVLDSGHELTGSLVVEQLGRVDQVVVLLCTIGARLEERLYDAADESVGYGLALDAVGSAAIAALSTAAVARLQDEAVRFDMETTLPLSPGSERWPFDPGQREIFALIDPAQVGVAVNSSLQMVPLKSLTLVIGVGSGVKSEGETCDFCGITAARGTTCSSSVVR